MQTDTTQFRSMRCRWPESRLELPSLSGASWKTLSVSSSTKHSTTKPCHPHHTATHTHTHTHPEHRCTANGPPSSIKRGLRLGAMRRRRTRRSQRSKQRQRGIGPICCRRLRTNASNRGALCRRDGTVPPRGEGWTAQPAPPDTVLRNQTTQRSARDCLLHSPAACRRDDAVSDRSRS